MSIVLLGAAGLQGKAALYDLSQIPKLPEIVAVDCRPDVVETYLKEWKTDNRISVVKLDARDEGELSKVMKERRVVINLLPSIYSLQIAKMAIENRVNLVDTGYIVNLDSMSEPATKAILDELDQRAKEAEVAILRECGMDPGIDLLMCGEAVRELDEVYELVSYGSGFPEATAANNALKYKITWTFDGVLRSYKRGGRYLKDGEIREFTDMEMFSPDHAHSIELPPFGKLDAFPNGDALAFAERLGIRNTVRSIGRFVCRWPGHCDFWYRIVQLHFLDDEPVRVGSVSVTPKAFTRALLEPQLQYQPQERDVVFIHVEARGRKNGEEKLLVYELIDERDLQTGLMAMNRTVGFSASIGAQMILRGDIEEKGLLSPLTDVPYAIFEKELRSRNIVITRFEHELE